MNLLKDKKFLITSLSSVVIIAVIIGIGYYGSSFFFDRGGEDTGEENDDDIGCLVMLPEEYCRSGKTIKYLDHDAVGFSLPEGIEIYAPFDGAFFEDRVIDDGGGEPITLRDFSHVRFGIPGTSSFVFLVAKHSQIAKNGDGVTAGQTVATFNVPEEPYSETSNSNFIVYTIDYDLQSLFK